MSQNLQNFAKFQKIQLDNLVDFEKCCKTHIFLQKSVPIQPKTSNILPKFCQKLVTTLRVRHFAKKGGGGGGGPGTSAAAEPGPLGAPRRSRACSDDFDPVSNDSMGGGGFPKVARYPPQIRKTADVMIFR